MGKTLYEKVFDSHTVGRLPSGQYQLFMGLHLIHEVTSPQAFSMLEEISSEHFMPSLFAKQRESSAAAVSKILRQLLGKDLVSVRLGARDGRQRRYELTAKGKRCIEGLRREREAAIRSVWNGFDSGDLDAFTHFGTRLAQRLTHYAESVKEGT